MRRCAVWSACDVSAVATAGDTRAVAGTDTCTVAGANTGANASAIFSTIVSPVTDAHADAITCANGGAVADAIAGTDIDRSAVASADNTDRSLLHLKHNVPRSAVCNVSGDVWLADYRLVRQQHVCRSAWRVRVFLRTIADMHAITVAGANECTVAGANECTVAGANECTVAGANQCTVAGTDVDGGTNAATTWLDTGTNATDARPGVLRRRSMHSGRDLRCLYRYQWHRIRIVDV